MLPDRVKAVFFDAVGTLIVPDPPAAVVYAEAGRRFGGTLDEVGIATRFRVAFRRREQVDFARGLRTSEAREVARWRAIVDEVLNDVAEGEACFQHLWEHFARPDAWRCDPDAAVVLAELRRQGRTVGIASNFDGRLRSVVAGLSALASAKILVISAEVGWRKPAPEFFADACRETALPAERVAMVGDDRVNDYDGARAAGLHAMLFDPRIGGLGDLLFA